jgi:hypothetical protein
MMTIDERRGRAFERVEAEEAKGMQKPFSGFWIFSESCRLWVVEESQKEVRQQQQNVLFFFRDLVASEMDRFVSKWNFLFWTNCNRCVQHLNHFQLFNSLQNQTVDIHFLDDEEEGLNICKVWSFGIVLWVKPKIFLMSRSSKFFFSGNVE